MRLGAAGRRDMGNGEEPVPEADLKEALRRRSRVILRSSLIGAAGLTAVLCLLSI